MNILHVIDQISQTKHGGSAKVPYQLAKAQAKLGHNVTILASDAEAEDQQPPEGVTLVKFKTMFTYQKMRFTPGFHWYSDDRFDILHIHNYRTFQSLDAAITSKPFVLQAHGSCRPIKAKYFPIHQILWPNLILKRARRLIADAPSEVTQYKAEGAKTEKISIIPVGIDLEEFKTLPERSPNGHKTILYVGRIDKGKGLDLLVKAFGLLKRNNVKLVIAGVDYGIEAALKAEAEGLNVDFPGPVYGQAKVDLLTKADIFVLPSLFETWGLAFMESLATGTPVVITHGCGAANILSKECGEVVLPNSEIYLSFALNKMLDNNAASECRDFRRDWVKQYSWESLAPRYIKLYEEVLLEKCTKK